MPKYFIWDKYEMSQPLIYQLCRESQTIKSSLIFRILFLESRTCENDDGTSRSEKKKKLREIVNIVVMYIARNCYLTLKIV